MKDFKQNTKMACEGSHYQAGGKVKKYAEGKGVSSFERELMQPFNENPGFTIGPNNTVVKNPKYKPEPTTDLMDRNPSFTFGPNGKLVKNPNYIPEPDPRMLKDLPTRNFPGKYKSGGKTKRGNKK